MNLLFGSFRELNKFGGVEVFRQISDVNQMVRNLAALFSRRFGSADVHAAINLHGINGNNLAPQPFAKFNCHRRFAHSGWADKIKRFAAFHERSAAGSKWRFWSDCIEVTNSNPTPTQIAVSATLNAGKPISPPPR